MKKNVWIIILCVVMCAALLSACGDKGEGSNAASPLSAPEGFKADGSDGSGDGSDGSGDGSDGDSEIVKTDTEYYNIVGRISSISGSTIEYTVYSALADKGISDYSVLNINAYVLTNQTNSIELDAETPVYIYVDGERVDYEQSLLEVGETIIMAYDWDEAALQFIVLANLAVGSMG